LERLDDRDRLLREIDANFAAAHTALASTPLDVHRQDALNLLASGRVRDAFDLAREPAAIRAKYGRNLYGQSTLVARRLVEAGVTFVTVTWDFFGENAHAWDTHSNNFNLLKDASLPVLDQCYPALVKDLEQRGLLDSTLVIVMGEMGRTPRVNPRGGRDHWPQCGFSLLVGGGVRRGIVFGSSDRLGAYPQDNPVSPANLVATIYHLMGIDPRTTVPDRAGRPQAIAHGGQPIHGVLA
jgi:uncharacterized protein (DUF1501 family)